MVTTVHRIFILVHRASKFGLDLYSWVLSCCRSLHTAFRCAFRRFNKSTTPIDVALAPRNKPPTCIGRLGYWSFATLWLNRIAQNNLFVLFVRVPNIYSTFKISSAPRLLLSIVALILSCLEQKSFKLNLLAVQ